jgi:hypothetical protein
MLSASYRQAASRRRHVSGPAMSGPASGAWSEGHVDLECSGSWSPASRGAKWGAIIGRHGATHSFLQCSLSVNYQLFNYGKPRRATLRISFASRRIMGSNPLSSSEFFQVTGIFLPHGFSCPDPCPIWERFGSRSCCGSCLAMPAGRRGQARLSVAQAGLVHAVRPPSALAVPS